MADLQEGLSEGMGMAPEEVNEELSLDLELEQVADCIRRWAPILQDPVNKDITRRPAALEAMIGSLMHRVDTLRSSQSSSARVGAKRAKCEETSQ